MQMRPIGVMFYGNINSNRKGAEMFEHNSDVKSKICLDMHVNPPTASNVQEVYVELDPSVMMDDFAKAFLYECERVNPLTFDRVNLTEEEMVNYCRFLLDARVQCIEGRCRMWRELKDLAIPSFIQLCLACVGTYNDMSRGLIFIPKLDIDVPLSIEEAREISKKIEYFGSSVVSIKDAMPRKKEGDPDVMTCALINNVISSVNHIDHDVFSYISAFLGMKLQEEVTFSILYRVRYDDLTTIVSKLLNSRTIYDVKDE